MKGLLWYRKDWASLRDAAVLGKIKDAGFDAVFYVVKDYNGEWAAQEELALLREVTSSWSLEVFAWVCVCTEGYSGRLAEAGCRPEFSSSQWSVLDLRGRDTIARPVECDFGWEQFACPANDAHTSVVCREVRAFLGRHRWVRGVLFDLVRYPLDPGYCLCLACNESSLNEWGKAVGSLSAWRRYQLKRICVRRLVERLECEVPGWKSFLVWPKPKWEDLTRTQDYGEWSVGRLSPMLYPTVGGSFEAQLRKFSSSWSAEVLPLRLAKAAPAYSERGFSAQDEIVTHYGFTHPVPSFSFSGAMSRAIYPFVAQSRAWLAKLADLSMERAGRPS